MSIKKNKLLNKTNIIIILLSLTLLSSCSKDDDVIATVGTHKITIPEFQKRYQEFLFSTGIKDNLQMRKDILDNMINEIILYYYDNNEEIFSDPEYQKELKWLEKEAILAFVKDRDIYAKITATDEEIRSAYYKAHVSLSARHLFARTKEEADNLYELLKAGADFNTLAKQVFTDSTLKSNGGYIGYFTWGDMDPAFEEAAYKLRPGEISKPVQTAQGYSIIKLEDRKVMPLMTEYDYQKRKKELERTLRISKKRPAEKEFLSKLFDRNKLTFDENAVNTLLKILNDKEYSIEEIDENITVCKYDNEEYGITQLYNKLNSIPSFHLNKITDTRMLKTAIIGILTQDKIYEYALKKNYDEKPEVKDAQYKLMMNKFLQTKMNKIALKADVSDSAAIKYYEENIHFFSEPKKINVQEIIVNRKSLADSLIEMLKRGEKFGVLAKKYSLRRWSAENDGFLGLSPLSQFGLIKENLWNAQVGKVVGPYQINNVFGIFKVKEKVDGHPIPFEEIKDQVKEKLRLDQRTRFVTDYLEKKRKEIDVNINYKNLKFSEN